MPTDVFIYGALRTPRGKNRGGALHGIKQISLVVGVLQALQQRNPGLDPARIDDVVFGCVTPIADQGANIARTASTLSGDTVPLHRSAVLCRL